MKREEEVDQIAFVQYVEYQYRNDSSFIPELFYHPLSGAVLGGSNKFALISKYKKMGWKKGIPDIMYDQPRGGYSKCVIELKKQTGGVVSPEQKRFLELIGKYAFVKVCNGYDEAVKAFDFYMKCHDEREVE